MGIGIALHLISAKDASQASPFSLDIVFMHGLGGDWKTTWESPSGYWPQWVADEFPYARVFSLEYPAAIGAVSQAALATQQDPQSLADSIADCFRNQNPRLGVKPCIFVCHSLGGLLLKRILIDANNRKNDHQWFRPDRVVGIIFLGTPHRGSELQIFYWLLKKQRIMSCRQH